MPSSLSANQVAALTRPGIHRVDHGLYLQIRGSGRSWLLRFQLNGRPRQMGLGPTRLVPLTEARGKALKAQRLLLDGIDPIEARQTKPRDKGVPSFAECAAQYIADHKDGWRNPKHRDQWEATLKTYANPVIGKLAPSAVTVDHVVQILKPIWSTKSETAARLRGRIERVLDWARAKGYRQGENPATWKGSLSHLLTPMGKIQKVEPRQAVPYASVPALLSQLRGMKSTSAKALAFTILTAARTNETIGATWGEMDLEAAVWTIPASRMKADKEHRVALSTDAVKLLKAVRPAEVQSDAFVFPGQRPKKPLSNMAMLQCLRGLRDGVGDTVHGFRSAFSTWAAEATVHPREIVEASLAHATGNAVELAYKRTDYIAKRQGLMQDWADFCCQSSR